MNTASRSSSGAAEANPRAASEPGQAVMLVVAWLAVGLPLGWGVAETLRKALALFQ